MQRKTLLTFVFFLVAFTAAAEELRFVTPLDRSQVFGPTRLEVATSQKSVDRVEFYVDDSLAGVSRKAPFGMMYDFGESISSHRIAARLFAHGYAIREDAHIVTAPLSASGEIAVDLVEVPLRISGPARVRPSDIELLENGATQKILEIRPERGPTRFVFVVDRSLSMGSGKLTASLRAIDSIQPQLRAGDDAEILFFNHQVSQPLPIQASLRGKPPVPSGGTSLRDAVASLQPVRRTIAVVISDGGDRTSKTSASESLRRVGQANITLYALVLGEGSASAFLKQAARNTGGSAIQTSLPDLERDINRIFADINGRFTVVYQSSAIERGWRGIDVLSRSSSLKVLGARAGYYAE